MGECEPWPLGRYIKEISKEDNSIWSGGETFTLTKQKYVQSITIETSQNEAQKNVCVVLNYAEHYEKY
jgi:hypothetical protein